MIVAAIQKDWPRQFICVKSIDRYDFSRQGAAVIASGRLHAGE
jgi:hypothetical protein